MFDPVVEKILCLICEQLVVSDNTILIFRLANMNQQEFGRKLLVDIKYPYFPHSIGAIVKGDNLNYDFILIVKLVKLVVQLVGNSVWTYTHVTRVKICVHVIFNSSRNYDNSGTLS